MPDKQFLNYPYASVYIQLNFLMLDPNTALIDSNVPALTEALAKYDVESINIPLDIAEHWRWTPLCYTGFA